jgi:hypothetical protein
MLTHIADLARRLAEGAGGVVQPIVVATSTAPSDIDFARNEVARADWRIHWRPLSRFAERLGARSPLLP